MVELIVAVGLFTTVMFIATGALLSIVALNKKAQAQQSAINNLNFALENMARSIRTGSDYRCNSIVDIWGGPPWQDTTKKDCDISSGGGSQIIFESEGGTSSNDDNWSYYLLGAGIIAKKGDSASAITAPEIVIEDLKFFVTGAENSLGDQPMVLMVVKGYAFVGDVGTANPRRVDFNLQTSASQRKLDV